MTDETTHPLDRLDAELRKTMTDEKEIQRAKCEAVRRWFQENFYDRLTNWRTPTKAP